MKIRSGFVSNSSSSSFIVIAPEETINKANKSLTDLGRAVVKDVVRTFETVTLDGKPYKLAHGTYSSEEFATGAVEKFVKDEDDYCVVAEQAMEQWQKFEESVEKLGGFYRETGC